MLTKLAGFVFLSGLLAQSPIPRWRVVVLPNQEISFERDGREVARYHHGAALQRPYVYPLIGPSGRPLTDMIHPGAPGSHSHHTSVWIGYQMVNGLNFWTDAAGPQHGRIVHRQIARMTDGGDGAAVVTRADWVGEDGGVLLHEQRRTEARAMTNGWLLVIELTLDAANGPVTLESSKTAYGPIGVRVAKSMSVQYGDGQIRNSEKATGERALFRRPARWVDYSGSVAQGVTEGLTLFDDPRNPGHPSPFHVREDGWMGAMLPPDRPTVIEKGHGLRLRYGVYVHAGAPGAEELDARWREFAALATSW